MEINPIKLRDMIHAIWAQQVDTPHEEIAYQIGISCLTLRKIMKLEHVKIRTRTILLINNWYNKHKGE